MSGPGFISEEDKAKSDNQVGNTSLPQKTAPPPQVAEGLSNSSLNGLATPGGEKSDPDLLNKIKNRGTQAPAPSFGGAAPLTEAQRNRARHLRRNSMSNKEYTPEEDDLKNRLALANERIEESGVDNLNAMVYKQEGLLGANEAPKTEAAGEKAAGPKAGKLKELGGLFKNIVKSKKDSSSYKKLSDDVTDVVDMLDERVTTADFSKVSGKALQKYNALIKSCEDYIKTHKNPWTASGKARKATAEQMLATAKLDVTAIYDGANVVAGKSDGMTLLELVSSEARTLKIDLDKDPRNVKVIGSGSSNRKLFNEGGKDVFFSAEETLKSQSDAAEEAIADIKDDKCRARFMLFYKNSPALFGSQSFGRVTKPEELESTNKILAEQGREPYASFRDCFKGGLASLYISLKKGWETARAGAGKDEAGADLDFEKDADLETIVDMALSIFRAVNGSSNAQGLAGLVVGQKVSNRNVATSRVADLLGIGDLVARSVNAEVTEKGKTTKGNLMEKARGEGEEAIFKKDHKKADMSSGEFQRQLICLQMLDSLCYQVDRNSGNMFYETEMSGEGENKQLNFKGMHAIDNDMAFGGKMGFDSGKVKSGPYNVKDQKNNKNKKSQLQEENHMLPALLDAKGNMELSVVDEDVAERIMALSPEMLKLALKDVLELDSEMYALIDRLESMQKALRNMKKKDKSAFKKRNEWGKGTAEKLTAGKSNYYTSMLNDRMNRR